MRGSELTALRLRLELMLLGKLGKQSGFSLPQFLFLRNKSSRQVTTMPSSIFTMMESVGLRDGVKETLYPTTSDPIFIDSLVGDWGRTSEGWGGKSDLESDKPGSRLDPSVMS